MMDREELDERAAIRQCDGGMAFEDAEKTALMDIVERRAAAKAAAAEKPATGTTIEQLRDQAARVWLLMHAAEGQKKENLLAEWFELAYKIIAVRKGVEKLQ